MISKMKGVFIALVLIFLYGPILILTAYSFTSATNIGAIQGFSMHNYVTLFTTPELRDMIIGTVILALGASAIATVLGTLGAIGAFYSKKRTNLLISTVNQIPVINADVVTGFSICILLVVVLGIDKDTFEKARRTIKKSDKSPKNDTYSLLKKLSYCAECGKGLVRFSCRTGIKQWRCSTKGCENCKPSLTDDELYTAINTILKQISADPELLETGEVLTEYIPVTKVMRIENEIARLKAMQPIDYDEVNRKLNAYREKSWAYLHGVIDKIAQQKK